MERLKNLRASKNMSQNKLAQILGVQPMAVSRYERGLREPDMETLQKLADYFDVSVDYLMGRTDIKKTPLVEAKGDKVDEIAAILHQLTPENQERLADYLKVLLRAQDNDQ